MLLNFFKKPKEGSLTAFYQDVRKHQNHFHHKLPYRNFDDEEGIFQNRASHGLGFKLAVLSGANDELIHSLNKLVCELPQGDKWDYQLSLFGHNKVAHYIDANAELMSKRGGICKSLAAREAEYAKFAANEGFFHKQRHHFDLRDYDAYFFVSTTTKDDLSLKTKSLMSQYPSDAIPYPTISKITYTSYCYLNWSFIHQQRISQKTIRKLISQHSRKQRYFPRNKRIERER